MTDELARAMRILIVEDEPLIAFEVEQTLTDAGFEIVGVAARVEEALAMIDDGALDAAVLDANLNRVSAAPIAIALTARGLPFVVTTGYTREQLPDGFKAGALIEKPCLPEQIIEALTAVLQANRKLGPAA
jgi:DNA-binding response OmpR family regulator